MKRRSCSHFPLAGGDKGGAKRKLRSSKKNELSEPTASTSGQNSSPEPKEEGSFDTSQIREMLIIFRCSVCLELPDMDCQVRTCIQGHHFCFPCFRKIIKCPICRGNFENGRNFAVENILSIMGSELGLFKSQEYDMGLSSTALPDTVPYMKGKFECLHCCKRMFTAERYIQHLRKFHAKEFYEAPFLNELEVNFESGDKGFFEFCLHYTYEDDVTLTKTYHSSYFGIFTVNVQILDGLLVAYIQMLADGKHLSDLKHSITLNLYDVKGVKRKFTVLSSDFLNYRPVQNAQNLNNEIALKVSKNLFKDFRVPDSPVTISVCIWKPKHIANIGPQYLSSSSVRPSV